MGRRSRSQAAAGSERTEETAPRPEPVGVVRRELTRPDGTTVVVDVPVYPPFRLEERAEEGVAPSGSAAGRGRGPGRRRKPPRGR